MRKNMEINENLSIVQLLLQGENVQKEFGFSQVCPLKTQSRV